MKKQSITDIVKNYRNKTNRHDGVVIVFDNRVSGWMSELRNPNGWVPGCIAIDTAEKQFKATGGNDSDGADHWEAIN